MKERNYKNCYKFEFLKKNGEKNCPDKATEICNGCPYDVKRWTNIEPGSLEESVSY